jgi:poly(3-hydroxybutyrate) depolymerase
MSRQPGFRTRALTVTAAISCAIAAAPFLGGASAVTAATQAGHHHHTKSHHPGLPADGPPALYKREPHLPKANGWPVGNGAFSRTSGTGRLDHGAFYWTDYLYDDHGTTTASTGGISVTAGTPSFGTYTYPPGPASENGADIFRAAVARHGHSTYWRVDWNTLAKNHVPIAEWTIDRDNDAATGGSDWAGHAGAHSPGIDTAIIVSSHGARVIHLPSGHVIAKRHTTVDHHAHSFVVRIPDSVLHPRGTWRIRLAAGLADPAGTGFAPAADAVPGQTRVYNVTFRTGHQEPIADDFWDDQAQTQALATGNVTKFSHLVHWAKLKHHVRTRQPQPTGWSDRWYVSDVDLGPGIITSPESIADGEPNYLGRVQPYAVYVPPSYRPHHSAPLTFLLHSLTQNQNQYAATTPKFTTLACKQRHSICVTTLGRGPDGNYFDDAELDFWQVWHEVAAAYRLKPNRTVLSGYSMGGIGTNQLAMAHPDLFARAVTLAGGVGNVPSLHNLHWVPTYLAGGAEDELVPVTVERAEADALRSLGDRYRWVLYPAIDHVAYELADSFADAARFMGHAHRVKHPGHFDFTWVPHNTTQAFSTRATTGGGLSWTQQPKHGVGTSGDYWLRHLHARHKAHTASLTATSKERPDRSITTHRHQNVDLNDGPEPGVVNSLTWTRGHRPHRHPTIRLHLHNVRSLKVLLHGAGFGHGHHARHGKLHVTTDGKTVIHLGHRRIHVRKGTHVIRFTA